MLKPSLIIKQRITQIIIVLLFGLALIVAGQTFWKTINANRNIQKEIVNTLLDRAVQEIHILLSQTPSIQNMTSILLAPKNIESEYIETNMGDYAAFLRRIPGIDGFMAKINAEKYMFISTTTNGYIKSVNKGKTSFWTTDGQSLRAISPEEAKLSDLESFINKEFKFTDKKDNQLWAYTYLNNNKDMPYLISKTDWGSSKKYGTITLYINAEDLMNSFEEKTNYSDEEIFIIKGSDIIPSVKDPEISKQIISHISENGKSIFSVKTNNAKHWIAMTKYSSEDMNFIIGLTLDEKAFHGLNKEANSFILSYVMLTIALILLAFFIIIKFVITKPSKKIPENMTEAQIKQIIAGGESDTVEFKSTMRWNLQSNKAGKEIEFAWLKTVAAFLNTSGGFIFIGVNDDGECIGIENDKFKNEDKFLLHFNNLIKTHIGLEFANMIHFAIRNINQKNIFIIKCDVSSDPVFLKHNGLENFYVRLGPASRELSVSSTIKYLKKRNLSYKS